MGNNVAEIQVSYSTNSRVRPKVTCGKSAFDLFYNSWSQNTIELQEEFKVMLLNRANNVLGIYPLSKGGSAGTVVDLKLLFAVALKCNASAIIIAHNHPSGTLKASEQDIKITKKIKEAGNLFEITLLDHIIITKNDFLSMANEGLF